MELSPFESPSLDTPTDKKKESRKRRKAKAESIGSILVESEPKTDKSSSKEKAKKRDEGSFESIWERLSSADPKESKQADEIKKLPEESPEKLDHEPIDQLSQVEEAVTNQAFARNRKQEISETAVETPDAIQLEQDAAALKYLELVEALGDPDAAAEKVAEAFAISLEQNEESEPEEVEIGDEEGQEEDPPEAFEPLPSDQTEEDDPVSPAAGGSGAGGSGYGRGGAGGATSPGPLPYGFSGGFPHTIGGPNHPIAAATNPNVITTADASYYERKALSRGLLVGGLVGYLIGRRRGRIKTERKMIPIQKRLEKQVKGLQDQLIAKEYALRRAVAAKHEAITKPVAAQTNERPSRSRETFKINNVVSREKIGHVVIAAEASTYQKEVLSKSPLTAEKQQNINPEEHAATMSRPELLALSEKIIVDGTTLRTIYETHLVGERGLRRLVAEYLAGRDIKKALRHELIEREIDFERDPLLRDRALSSVAGGGKSAVSALTHVVASLDTETVTKAPQPKPQAEEVSVEPAKAVAAVHHRSADISLAATILLLLGLIIYIMMSR